MEKSLAWEAGLVWFCVGVCWSVPRAFCVSLGLRVSVDPQAAVAVLGRRPRTEVCAVVRRGAGVPVGTGTRRPERLCPSLPPVCSLGNQTAPAGAGPLLHAACRACWGGQGWQRGEGL